MDADNYAKFVEMAKASGCDEDAAAFEAKLRQIARVKPKPADDKTSEADKP